MRFENLGLLWPSEDAGSRNVREGAKMAAETATRREEGEEKERRRKETKTRKTTSETPRTRWIDRVGHHVAPRQGDVSSNTLARSRAQVRIDLDGNQIIGFASSRAARVSPPPSRLRGARRPGTGHRR